MKSRNEIVFKAFLSRCSEEKQQKLSRFLSEETKAHLKLVPSVEKAADPKAWLSSDLLDTIHWSWLLAPLKTYTAEEQKYFLASLSPHLAHSLSKSLNLSPPFPELTKSAGGYFRSILEKHLLADQEDFLPSPCLPDNTLSELLDLSKKQLMHLVNLLSLQDLAAEIRQIVDTKILKKVYSFLTDEEKKRLKEISSHSEPFGFIRLSLDRWDGMEESLRLLLHKRGLARLGLALAGQDPHFVWHICHQFDIGRGSNLLKFSSKEISEEQRERLSAEIKELIRGYL